MQQLNDVFIGVDVAKAELVIALHGGAQRPLAVPNEERAIEAWLSTLSPCSFVAMESTGRYHGLLARLAQRAGHRVYVLNARDVKCYAQALGTRGKTDRVDSLVIARYIAELHERLHEWAGDDTVHSRLSELLRRRASVATHFSAVRQTMKGVPGLDAALAQLALQHKAFLASIDKEVARLIATDDDLKAGAARLATIPGVGPQTSAMLAALFGRITFVTSDAVVAYSGLDPRPNDSGAKRGRRRLSKKGPPELRRQMWLAGFAATRSKALKPLYQALRARGLSTTAAIVALGRKLLRIAYAVWKTKKPFDLSQVGVPKV